MYVRNVAGYNFAFRYRDSVIHVPFDGQIYSIPDDSGRYHELRVIMPMHIRTQNVIYINKDGSRASENISGHKRRGRPPKPEPVVPVEPVETPDTDQSVVNVDLDSDICITIVGSKEGPNGEKADVKPDVKQEEPPKKKRGRPRKTDAEKEQTNATPKKRGRPRKTEQSSAPKKRGRPRKTTK